MKRKNDTLLVCTIEYKTLSVKRIALIGLALLFPILLFAQETPAFKMNKRLGRGVNIGNVFDAPSEGAWNSRWFDSYIPTIDSLGFSHLRLPVRWDTHTTTSLPYTIDPAYLNRISGIVDDALRSGLHVVLDMHHYDNLFTYHHIEGPRSLEIWRQIAEHFKSYPDSLVFEIINEPIVSAAVYNQYAIDALNVIRQTNPNRTVILCTPKWQGIDPNFVLPPNDNNLIVTIHYYNPSDFTHQDPKFGGTPGVIWRDTDFERDAIIQDFQEVIQFSKAHNVPINIGEFGVCTMADMDSRAKWNNFTARFFEEQGFSWTYWALNMSDFGFYRVLQGAFDQPVVNALLSNYKPIAAPTTMATVYECDFQSTPLNEFGLQNNGTGQSTRVLNNGAMEINITEPGTSNWHVQLSRQILLEKNKRYRVSFKAKATEACVVTSFAGAGSGGSDHIPFTLTTEEQTFSHSFLMTGETNSRSMGFSLGASITGTISLYSVKVETITIDPFTPVAAADVALNKTSINLNAGANETLTATISPLNTTVQSIHWSSSDKSIAAVDANGKVTGRSEGTTTIIARTSNSKFATCEVTVSNSNSPIVAADGVTLNKTITNLNVGEDETLTATVTPANAADKSVTWTSSDNNIATVGADGKVTAVSEGTATITATTANGKTATCIATVTVNNSTVIIVAADSVTLDKAAISLITGADETLTATVHPTNATDKTITWTSSDNNTATVGTDGKVTAVGEGVAAIIATTANGKIAICTITVTKDDTGINEVSKPSLSAYPNPTNGHVTVTGLTAGTIVKLYSASGSLVDSYTASAEEMSIDLSQMSQGLYYLKTETEIIKIIKK